MFSISFKFKYLIGELFTIMMNKGSIIDQGRPDELIKKHKRNNMEEVFLKLTREKYEFK